MLSPVERLQGGPPSIDVMEIILTVVSKYVKTSQFSLSQRLAENRSDPGRPPEEDPQQRPVHEGADEPVAHDHGMTAGGAVPRNGQHSQDHQQQREPPNDPPSVGTRQSRNYSLTLIH